MKMTSELYCLTLVASITVLMWIPYMFGRIATRGFLETMGNPSVRHAADPDWAERGRRAHGNMIENLVPFGFLVLVGAVIGISTPTTAFAAKAYVAARLLHYVSFSFGIPVLRTLAFFGGVAACLAIAVALLVANY